MVDREIANTTAQHFAMRSCSRMKNPSVIGPATDPLSAKDHSMYCTYSVVLFCCGGILVQQSGNVDIAIWVIIIGFLDFVAQKKYFQVKWTTPVLWYYE